MDAVGGETILAQFSESRAVPNHLPGPKPVEIEAYQECSESDDSVPNDRKGCLKGESLVHNFREDKVAKIDTNRDQKPAQVSNGRTPP
jgi:hypothetical protein